MARLVLRVVELVCVMLLVCFAAAPLTLLLLVRKLTTGRPVLVQYLFTTANGRRIETSLFAVDHPGLARLALLPLVVRSTLRLIGTSITSGEPKRPSPENGYLLKTPPGLISLWYLRSRSNTGHEGQAATEWEHHFSRTPLSDLTLLLRAIPASLYGSKDTTRARALSLFGIRFANLSMVESISLLEQAALQRTTATSVFFINPDCLNKTFADPDYQETLATADHVFPDGIGLTIAGKILGTPLKENVNGTDMLPFLCQMAAARDLPLFLLGGRPGVAEKMAENITSRYGVTVAGTHHGYFDHEHESSHMVELINAAEPAIVLVAFGAPLQEKWIRAHQQQLRAGVVMGVGGLFDFYAGTVRRAPRWLRELGLEWFYRILQEPGRMWRRYVIGNPLFLFRVLREKFSRRNTTTISTSEQERLRKLDDVSEGVSARRLRAKVILWQQTVAWTLRLKRAFDLVASSLIILALSPLFLVTALCISLESSGPVFYFQERVGRNGRTFRFYKFRSMVVNADTLKENLAARNESSDGVLFKMKEDPRITRVGRFIRKYSIDELPQLFNVLRGDMSLVGPRPARPAEVGQYTLEQRKRLHVLPGITCLWQVSGRSEIPFTGQVQLDLEYIKSTSIMKDLLILLQTIPAVLTGKGAY